MISYEQIAIFLLAMFCASMAIAMARASVREPTFKAADNYGHGGALAAAVVFMGIAAVAMRML